MKEIKGYRILEIIKQGEQTIICRGERQKDKKKVVIKALQKEYPSLMEITQLKHEYEVLKKLDFPGAVKPISLEKYNNRLALILEDFGGESLEKILDTQKISLVNFLKIAIVIATNLEEIHKRNIIHKDIKPSNIIINQETREVKLIDFGLASQLASENHLVRNPNLLEGTLAYMSPEQTGRMNRSIDYRTDFYSLGITLYEMLTGVLPFPTQDPMEIVHCHIAKIPATPHEQKRTIPQEISDIVMKLLAKIAEDRYQTAFGLKSDLETCLNQLLAKGKISHFLIGQQDLSSQFYISQKLYGREAEIAVLMDTFERVSQGKAEMMLVSGYSGIGKSALVHEIYKPIVRQGGFFISGKFDQFQRNIPYSSLIQSFQELTRQLLTENQENIKLWRKKLLEALGVNGQVIIDVIPEIELIVGKQPPLPPLEPTHSQNRFNLVFQKFISVFTQPEHPLVLFLDDLQWADSASLKFIYFLMTTVAVQYLLIIGAYRDNEVSKSHPLLLTLNEIKEAGATINTITVKPLDLSEINQLIADALHCKTERAKPLAELCLYKTNGNPFFLNQLLKSLYADGLLIFDRASGSWQWDLEQIQRLGITDNVVDLMIDKIQKFSKQTQNLLKLAACIGNKFDLEVLSVVNEKSPSATATDLWQGLQQGLILPLNDDYKIPLVFNHYLQIVTEDNLKIEYKFLHDRVQQAAYTLISQANKKKIHLKIGQLLLNNTNEKEIEEKIFDIVNHLNAGAELITSTELICQLTQLNLIAGNKAKASTAYETALKYFVKGIEIWLGDIWQDNYDLAFTLYQERSECEYLCGNFEQAEYLFDLILSRAKSNLEKAEIQNIRLALYDNSGKYLENLQVGAEALKNFEIDIPKTATDILLEFERELQLYQNNLTAINIANLINAPEMTDLEMKASLKLLMNMAGPAYFTDQDLLVLILIKMINISIQHGNSDVSAHGYAFWGTYAISKLNDYQSGYEFGQLALKLSEKYNNSNIKCKVANSVGAMIIPWRRHLKSSIPILRDGYKSGVETGDVYTGYNSVNLINQRILMADNSESIIAESNSHLDFLKKMKNYVFIELHKLDQHFLLNFQGLTRNKFSLSDNEFDELKCVEMCQENLFFPGVAAYHILKTQISFLYGDYKNALKMAQESQETVDFVSGLFIQTEHFFYYSLTLAALYPTATESKQKQYLKILKNNQQKMKIWADNCPENFLHKYLLVAAEIARIWGKDMEAIDLYDRAIASAKENEFIQNEALGNELAAKFWLSKGKEKIAKIYITEAYYGYQNWGARRKVEDLVEKYPKLLSEIIQNQTVLPPININDTTSSTTSSNASFLDLITVIRASQALTSEIVLNNLLSRLLKIVIENAGAQKGFLILQKEGDWFIEAEGKVNENDVTILQSIPVHSVNPTTQIPLLSAPIVNYVANTQEDVVLNDAVHEEQFANDTYINATQTKSILCTPLLNQGKLSGIVYLENNLTTGAFTPERVEILRVLSAQAAISIENSRLYEQLEDYSRTLEKKVEARTQELQEKNEELAATLQKLKATQAQIIAQEKLASLGALTAGIAHEIKNPLNFVNNFAEMSIELTEELLEEIEHQKDRLDSETREYIEEILNDLSQNAQKINEHGKRADSIVRGMLMHSRGQTGERQLTDINALLAESVNLAYHGMRAKYSNFNITIETDYDHELDKMHIVPQDISRVFLNIINNACYAVHEKEQEIGERFSPTLLVRTRDLGERVEIRIRDNGKGIPQEVMNKIFNPFFTTKPAGEGTGLGLSLSHDIIVQQNLGELRIETELGNYTEFIIILPKNV